MKKIKLIIFTFFAFFFSFYNALATSYQVRVEYSDVNLRKEPSTGSAAIKKAALNASYNLVSKDKIADQKGCPDGWYHVYYSGENSGYICSTYVTLLTIEDVVYEGNTECEKDLAIKGFPQSYMPGLCTLKTKYPNWNFIADKNGLDFNTAISKESVTGKSLIQTSYEGYLSTASDSYDYAKDSFIVKEGKNWYAASSDVVAYYLDPRNFFNEKNIFMFEKLSYDSSYQTLAAIENVLSGRDIKVEANTISNASSSNNINAIYLASRIVQETGGNYTNYSLQGNSITYNNVKYDHVYNPYNIGANTGAYDGLVWAVSGDSYQRPWTNLQTAILGGAQVIANTYISKGQDSGYFQKFNTSSYSAYSAYSHQYMSNIKAAESESIISYNGYSNMGLLSNTNFTFVIPVYSNMKADKYALPNTGNPNNHLSNITINGNQVTGFAHDNYKYTYYIASGINEIDLNATSISSKAKVSGIGKIKLDQQKTDVEISVAAENGSIQKYVITVVKTDGAEMTVNDIINNISVPVNSNYMTFGAGNTVDSLSSQVYKTAATATIEVNNKQSGILATGDIVTIKNGNDTKTYNIVIKGDPTGDGNINIQDLLKVQKYILGYSDLSGSFLKGADTNNDGIVDLVDLLRVQKHILGYLSI